MKMKNKESVAEKGVGNEKITAKSSGKTGGKGNRRKCALNVTKYIQLAD